jgi:hypothetical protein
MELKNRVSYPGWKIDHSRAPGDPNYELPVSSTNVMTNKIKITNEAGGHGSKMAVAHHLIPNKVLKALAKVYNFGAYVREYGAWNWRKVEWWDHYNHLQEHLQNVRAELGKAGPPINDRDQAYLEDELEHALCRMSMMFSSIVGIDDELVDKKD